MKKLLLLTAGLALLAGASRAQFTNTPGTSLPKVQSVGPTDLIQVIPGGVPGVQSQYATAALTNGIQGYQVVVPLTAFSLTFNNGQMWFLLQPAGTLATGTITMQPNPGDGQRACVRSTQTQTAITITANTGQTIGGTAVTALVANTTVCWTYQASVSTWWPS